MREQIRLIFHRICERLVQDLHHLGIALVPAMCERLLWIALLSFAVFVALVAIQILMEPA